MTDPNQAPALSMGHMLERRDQVRQVLGLSYDDVMEPYRVRFRACGKKKMMVACEAIIALRGSPIEVAKICAALLDVYEEEARVTVLARRN